MRLVNLFSSQYQLLFYLKNGKLAGTQQLNIPNIVISNISTQINVNSLIFQ